MATAAGPHLTTSRSSAPGGGRKGITFIDKMMTLLDEAEHDMRAMTRDYTPRVLTEYLAGAAETRRELEPQRRDILLDPKP